ncbi:MBL fold metallo-hydrolase [Virgibacillus sp. 179-BFC.A HS]|uniref:MBL fold metallo-hydrolase n=1 Tax=Tigheibacillus jepli TaxID=3035914 RepID=A0ABU5CD09_9BACI|nr:MBL fold metallo-hydrolase [Virgibacillus sp. 179-BFC.A HS]MDY0404224.1 MBL fold metallo-hydrolase [Virgibacillus sp. 179-BFC.A HS]
MPTEIAPDIHKLVITFPGGMGSVNSYLIKGKQGYTVIDTGMYSNEAIENWKRILETGISIEKVVLTHTHQDHIGLAKWFQQEVGVPVIVSELGVAEMRKYRSGGVIARIANLVATHGGPNISVKMDEDSFIYDFQSNDTFQNHQQIKLGDDLYEAIWTPGHAPDHFCFYNADKKIMIAGDHILKDISPVIGLWEGKEANPLKDYFPALERMENYPAKIALPGHGEPIENLEERARQIHIRHHHRLEEVLEIIKNRPMSAYDVCQTVYGTMHIRLQLSSFMATLTRLLYLEAEGKVERMEKNGVVVFGKGQTG